MSLNETALTTEEISLLDVFIDMGIQSRDHIKLELDDATIELKPSTVDALRIIQCKLAAMRGCPDAIQHYRASRRAQGDAA